MLARYFTIWHIEGFHGDLSPTFMRLDEIFMILFNETNQMWRMLGKFIEQKCEIFRCKVELLEGKGF